VSCSGLNFTFTGDRIANFSNLLNGVTSSSHESKCRCVWLRPYRFRKGKLKLWLNVGTRQHSMFLESACNAEASRLPCLTFHLNVNCAPLDTHFPFWSVCALTYQRSGEMRLTHKGVDWKLFFQFFPETKKGATWTG